MDTEKDKDDHNIKLKKNCKKNQEINVIKDVSDYIDNNNLGHLKGTVYVTIHNIIIFVIAFVLVFNTFVIQLCVTLVFLSLDAFSIVVLHEYPLAILEKKYVGLSSSDMRNIILQNLKTSYN
jgi:hypothetical protein